MSSKFLKTVFHNFTWFILEYFVPNMILTLPSGFTSILVLINLQYLVLINIKYQYVKKCFCRWLGLLIFGIINIIIVLKSIEEKCTSA